MRAMVAVAALLFALPVGGSLLDDASDGEVSYQFDGATTHDAPDTCARGHPDWSFALGRSTDGLLAPPDDLADFFLLDIPSARVGTRVEVTLAEGIAAPNEDLMVFMPACAGDVFEPANQPFPFPSPPAPKTGESQVTVDNLNGSWTCDTTWSFIVNQLHGAPAPPSIHVAWTDGTELDLTLTKASNGAAHYNTTAASAYLLTDAWANLPTTWTGTFRIGAGPCAAVDGGAIYGAPAVAGDDRISFTPIRSGAYAVRVTPSLTPGTPPSSIPVSCHFCFGPGIETGARYGSFTLTAW